MYSKKYKTLFVYPFILLIFCLAAFSAYIVHSLIDLDSVKTLERYSPPVPTRVLDVKGRVIGEFYTERRELANYEELPPWLIRSTLITEDERFFNHYGFNPWRILKALYHNVTQFKTTQGGSTITIQLSKLLFLHHRRTIKRKLQELWYAIQIERLYTKKEILLFYFNQINYGHGCYGVKAAARFFFNKNLSELTIAECAMLAGIPKSPTYYSPLRKIRLSMNRHKVVFYGLHRAGYLSIQEYQKLYNDFWFLYASSIRSRQSTISELENNKAKYFIEYIRGRLDKTIGKKALYEGGLTVHTSLNLDHQKVAEKLLWEELEKQNRIGSRKEKIVKSHIDSKVYDQLDILTQLFGLNRVNIYDAKTFSRANPLLLEKVQEQLKTLSLLMGQDNVFNVMHLSDIGDRIDLNEKAEGAFISIDPRTGYITAMVGGSGFNYNNQINHVFLAKRQIGSLIKPFVYAAGIDTKTITAGSMINDSPVAFGNIEDIYIPQNYTGEFKGDIIVRDALRKSVNIAAVKVLSQTGIQEVRNYAAKMFLSKTEADIAEKFPNDLTMGLGSGSFSPIDVAVAYSVLANEGREVIPLSIRYITDRYGEIYTNFEKAYVRNTQQIINPATAFIINQILTGVFDVGGTAYRWDLLENFPHRRYSAGKTGTTSNWKDAWFAGFNKYLVAVVWIGYNGNKSLGKGRSGSSLSAPIWIKFNKEVTSEKSPSPFVKPNNVVKRLISKDSGLLASPFSRSTYEEYFIKGTEPKEFCQKYRDDFEKKSEFADQYGNKDKKTSKDLKNFMDLINKGE